MRYSHVRAIGFMAALVCGACITRPGMNADCVWPAEETRTLDPSDAADLRHLTVDAELLDELVDRYRFHGRDEQRNCERRLIDAIARVHSVSAADVAGAREHTSDRGLNLAVNVPVAAVFVFAVLHVTRRIRRRFSDDRLPAVVALVLACIVVPGLFLFVGEFWTSILEMIRVGSQHVGGRVQRLPWRRHELQIFGVGVALFWLLVLVRSLSGPPASEAMERSSRETN